MTPTRCSFCKGRVMSGFLFKSRTLSVFALRLDEPASFPALARVRLGEALGGLRWLAIIVPMAIVVGSLCAGFLWSLDVATAARFAHPDLLYALPVAGFAMVYVYQRFGRGSEAGNNLIVDQIHEPGGGVPLRMAPLILVSTVATHLFGGSAGREGTAVQLGGSIAGAFGRMFRLQPAEVRLVLMAGIAAGFGAVFGTPIAGAIFALEVLTIGRIQYEALVPSLVAAIVGDWSCHAFGVQHISYHIAFMSNPADATGFHLEARLLLEVGVAGILFGLVARFFAELSHGAQDLLKRAVPYAPLRAVVGGLIVIALVEILGTREYLGLGVWSPHPGDLTIARFFEAGPMDPWSWLWKIVFTVATLASGFKGGEVTPLFFIGAALGHALGVLFGAPVDLFAALGFVAVFAGASNTPLACMIMGIELFGSTHTVYIAVACFLAYLASGHSGIYLSQRLGVPKTVPGGRTLSGGTTPSGAVPPDLPLRHVREMRRAWPGARSAAPHPGTELTDQSNVALNEVRLSMPHALAQTEIGMVRIYLKPRERAPGSGRRLFGAKPLYRSLVLAAKQAGIINAVAHHTHYGYSNHGRLEVEGPELANPELTMCVELIAPRDQLEAYCRKHGGALRGKVIIYKHLERWDIVEPGSRHEATALATHA